MDQRNRNRRREHINLVLSNLDGGKSKLVDGNVSRHYRCEDNGCGWTGWLIPLSTTPCDGYVV